MQAKDTGVDPGRIEEYSVLRKSSEVDKNLLVVLKKSSRMHLPEKVVPADELAAVCRIEEPDTGKVAGIPGEYHDHRH